MTAINKHITFDDDPTHSGTTASEAFTLRRGVCQDYAHVFIACARAGGVPARFVSGHFLRADGVVHQPAGHAWAARECALPRIAALYRDVIEAAYAARREGRPIMALLGRIYTEPGELLVSQIRSMMAEPMAAKPM